MKQENLQINMHCKIFPLSIFQTTCSPGAASPGIPLRSSMVKVKWTTPTLIVRVVISCIRQRIPLQALISLNHHTP
ncbi:hypothetical protein EMPG_11360 [Blastomyces silverae]|uniref:Uncharacterized protein n=1 Tax=Blastomyces silverae TaxID=2060906 RepID=A0A0H1BRT0_9EURO|nr:hypothetical protein EMPG_11360 [Blastomyces silverae]